MIILLHFLIEAGCHPASINKTNDCFSNQIIFLLGGKKKPLKQAKKASKDLDEVSCFQFSKMISDINKD